jgi:hypothetical protein
LSYGNKTTATIESDGKLLKSEGMRRRRFQKDPIPEVQLSLLMLILAD